MPTPRAVTERLFKIRQNCKAAGNGNFSISASGKKATTNSPKTPKKPRVKAESSTPTSQNTGTKRKRGPASPVIQQNGLIPLTQPAILTAPGIKVKHEDVEEQYLTTPDGSDVQTPASNSFPSPFAMTGTPSRRGTSSFATSFPESPAVNDDEYYEGTPSKRPRGDYVAIQVPKVDPGTIASYGNGFGAAMDHHHYPNSTNLVDQFSQYECDNDGNGNEEEAQSACFIVLAMLVLPCELEQLADGGTLLEWFLDVVVMFDYNFDHGGRTSSSVLGCCSMGI